MKKIYLIPILFLLIINCSKNDTTNEIENEKEEEIENLAPNDFDVEINNVSHDNATINWNEATDPENESVSYSIYLNQTLLVEETTELTYKFENLSELTDYIGKVIAKDINNNETQITFSFKTKKYYLKYLKRFDYGPANFGTGYAHGGPHSMIKSDNQNYIVAGASSFPNGSAFRFFVSKIDYEGNEIWKKFYDYELLDVTNFEMAKSSNGFVLVGHHHILNLDHNGDIIWYKKIDSYDIEDGAAQIKSVALDSQNNLYIVGGRGSIDPETSQEAVLTKLNNQGEVIWEKLYRPTNRNFFYDIKVNNLNQLIIVGSVESSERGFIENGYWMLKLNQEGNVIWENSFGFGNHGIPNQVIIKKDGNYAFVGYKNVFEVSLDGNNVSNYPNFMTNPKSIVETIDGGLIVTGSHYPPTEDFDKLGLVKYSISREIEWEKVYSGFATYVSGSAVLVEEDGGYRIAGASNKLNYYDEEKPNLLIYKTDPEGNFE